MAEILQGCGSGREVLFADVGEEHMLARALAAGDRLADAAGAGDEEYVVAHVESLRGSEAASDVRIIYST